MSLVYRHVRVMFHVSGDYISVVRIYRYGHNGHKRLYDLLREREFWFRLSLSVTG